MYASYVDGATCVCHFNREVLISWVEKVVTSDDARPTLRDEQITQEEHEQKTRAVKVQIPNIEVETNVGNIYE